MVGDTVGNIDVALLTALKADSTNAVRFAAALPGARFELHWRGSTSVALIIILSLSALLPLRFCSRLSCLRKRLASAFSLRAASLIRLLRVVVAISPPVCCRLRMLANCYQVTIPPAHSRLTLLPR